MNGMNNENQMQQMSKEELQRTQVLNLKDIEEAARIEKMTSKKPAIIVAAIGALAILFGSAYSGVQTLMANNKDVSKVEKKAIIETKNTMNCTYTKLNNINGTDAVLNIDFTFEDDMLTKFTKNYSINPTAGNPQGPTSITSYTDAYQQFLIQLDGYLSTLTKSGDGIIVTSVVDLTKLDITKIPAVNQTNIATKVEYTTDMDKATIKTNLTTNGYICQ